MAQASEKVNMSTKLEKIFSFAQKWLCFPKIQFLTKSSFLKNLWPIEKSNPLPFHDKSLCNKPQWYSVVTTSPRVAGRTKRRYRKKTKILKVRAATEAHLTKMKAQYQTFQTRYSSFLSGTRSWRYWWFKIFHQLFWKLKKNTQVNWR